MNTAIMTVAVAAVRIEPADSSDHDDDKAGLEDRMTEQSVSAIKRVLVVLNAQAGIACDRYLWTVCVYILFLLCFGSFAYVSSS
jgi:hypothetical protein